MNQSYTCIFHGDAWGSEENMLDHQISYFSSEMRRYQKLYNDLRRHMQIFSHSINNIYDRGQRLIERESWIEQKEREMEAQDRKLQVREGRIRVARRRLRMKARELEDRERRFYRRVELDSECK